MMRWSVGFFMMIWVTAAWSQQDTPNACEMQALTITMVPEKNIDEQIRAHQPLIRLLGEKLGMPVEIIRATSYESVIDSMVSGAVDLAVMGPAAYMMAFQRNPDIEAFASLAQAGGLYSPAGSYYNSILLVNHGSGIRTIEDLRGKRVALGDPASTSGAVVPRAEFPEVVGEGLDTYFESLLYAGAHDKALNALLENRVDGAFVASTRADAYLKKGLINEESFRVLWSSRPLHFDPFVFRAGLCPIIRERIRAVLMAPSPDRQAYLENLNATDITPVSHTDYQHLQELL
ncbi:phosphate/phosphite/phosphonate ABC transporter substrate-binding protein [Marinobacter salinexigens]|uniref:Phosphate/phosphite/phosphonate ABC transporter substrate-binding protein n=1 Tax=Marinobacter salinexigens TaxID=2919747 RepID=A0A5B0VID7_9GAMM|nr:phosphate/phosphite/phosphonate ABC transporter substrate-binding protein [Marinobacter salinexigens]KAA1174168.1 phosphate/phosphite/phosphonate ABC transporter substrate-binding protein [Marinobacter salinexigens]